MLCPQDNFKIQAMISDLVYPLGHKPVFGYLRPSTKRGACIHRRLVLQQDYCWTRWSRSGRLLFRPHLTREIECYCTLCVASIAALGLSFEEGKKQACRGAFIDVRSTVEISADLGFGSLAETTSLRNELPKCMNMSDKPPLTFCK